MVVLVVPAVGVGMALALGVRFGVHRWQITLLAASYAVTMFGITAGLHRHFAHRTFRTSVPMRVVLAVIGSMAAQGPLMFWVTAHRRHHAYSDGPGDPHSPNLSGPGWLGKIRGFWHSHMGWMLVEDVSNWSKFACDLLRHRYLFTLHQLYPVWVLLGLLIPTAIGGAIERTWLGALEGLLWGGLVRIFLVNQAAWCVGSVCHMFGARPFPTPDHSGNVSWVAWMTFGEGLQNNHHAFPGSTMHALRWWQPDISGWIIRLCEWLGLVWDVRIPSHAVQTAARRRGYRGLDPRMQNILADPGTLESTSVQPQR
jgi:stearoyl-CoA desaturase (delta-9 desaturase)